MTAVETGLLPKYSVRSCSGEVLAPGTFFVVRATDVFAAAGLYAYAHSVETVLELDRQTSFLSTEQQAYLIALADRAASLAKQWQAMGLGAVPD